MKKIGFIFIFYLLLLIPNMTFAMSEGHLIICNYSGDFPDGVMVGIRNGKWYLNVKDGDFKEDKTGTPSYVFSKDDYDVYIDEGYLNNIKNFKSCPKHVYVDYNAKNSVCFTSKEPDETKCDKGDKRFTLLQCQFSSQDCGKISLVNDVQNYFSNHMTDYFEELLNEFDGDLDSFATDFNEASNRILEEAFRENNLEYLSPEDKEKVLNQIDKEGMIKELIYINSYKIQQKQQGLSSDSEEYQQLQQLYENFEGEKILNVEDIESTFENIGDIIISEITDCESLLGNPNTEYSPAWYLTIIFEVIKYIALGILIALSIMDFVGAVASHDNEILKKATNKVISRFIMCVVIWILPTLIKVFLNYVDSLPNDLCIK